jgi:arsenate reductase (glutaredoxin)
VDELRDICRKLGVRPRELLRAKDPLYSELGLERGRESDDELLDIMARHPGLIQRPIVVTSDDAVVARPTEMIDRLLK